MNTKSQLIIDQLVAKPIGFCLNFLVRIVGKILRINHQLDVEFSKIVVCKFKGLGSIIQATPMLQSLREIYPNAEITFLSTKANLAFLTRIKVIDNIVTVDDSSILKLIGSLSRTIFVLIKKRPEVYIDLEIYSNFSTLVTLSSLSKNRIGFYLRSSSFKMGIYTHMMYYNTNLPISEVYMQIARLFSNKASSKGLYPIYKTIVKTGQYNLENYIVINPNASDLRIERRWDGAKFRLLTNWLCTNYPNKKIVFIGSKSEFPYVSAVLDKLEYPNLLNAAGKTNVDELIQLIHGAELMISNDTGPMHIAFSCNTPTVALFGPCSPEQYAWNTNTKIIYKKVYCSPCVHEFITPPCKGNNTCMKLISLQDITKEIEYFYQNAAFSKNETYSEAEVRYQSENIVLGKVNR